MLDDEPTPVNGNKGQSNLDLIKDIFGDSDNPAPSPQSQPTNVSSILDLFNTPNTPAQPQQVISSTSLLGDLSDLDGLSTPASPPQRPQLPPQPPAIPAYNKNDLEITLQLQRTPDGVVGVMAKFRNTGFMSAISGVNLQAAVPRSQTLLLQPISTAELGAGGEATQFMRVRGSRVGFLSDVDRWSVLTGCFVAAAEVEVEDTICEGWECDNGSGGLVGAQVVRVRRANSKGGWGDGLLLNVRRLR